MLHKYEIGVCLNEDVAYLLKEKYDENLITIIHADEQDADRKTRNRKQAFFKRIFEMIRDFEKVSLCGPASVKTEIKKLFRDNSLKDVQIDESDGEEITESQRIEFINSYFGTAGKS